MLQNSIQRVSSLFQTHLNGSIYLKGKICFTVNELHSCVIACVWESVFACLYVCWPSQHCGGRPWRCLSSLDQLQIHQLQKEGGLATWWSALMAGRGSPSNLPKPKTKGSKWEDGETLPRKGQKPCRAESRRQTWLEAHSVVNLRFTLLLCLPPMFALSSSVCKIEDT